MLFDELAEEAIEVIVNTMERRTELAGVEVRGMGGENNNYE